MNNIIEFFNYRSVPDEEFHPGSVMLNKTETEEFKEDHPVFQRYIEYQRDRFLKYAHDRWHQEILAKRQAERMKIQREREELNLIYQSKKDLERRLLDAPERVTKKITKNK